MNGKTGSAIARAIATSQTSTLLAAPATMLRGGALLLLLATVRGDSVVFVDNKDGGYLRSGALSRARAAAAARARLTVPRCGP